MRIISGQFKGRKITAPKNLPVRPTTDQAKEGLFNILNNQIEFEGLKVLDLFSGTGNISMEFLSRGAGKVSSVDANYHCVQFQKSLARDFEIEAKYRIFKSDVFRAIKGVTEKFDVIFADPPYQLDRISELPAAILDCDILSPDGILVIEHGSKTNFDHPKKVDQRKYGSVHFSIFHP